MAKLNYGWTATGLFLGGAGLAYLSLRWSRFGFAGFDLSPMVDSAWRVSSGQVPGRDFVVIFPPSLYLLNAFFFRLFGVTWHALALGASCFYLLLLVAGLRIGALVRRAAGDRTAGWSAAAYAVALTVPLIIPNTLWHSTLASMFGVLAVYATFAFLKLPQSRRWLRFEVATYLTIAFAALLLSKINTAYPALLLCLFCMVRGGLRARYAAILAAAAVVLASIALAPVHVTLLGSLAGYIGIKTRLLPPKAFWSGLGIVKFGLMNLLAYVILAPLLTGIAVWTWRNRKVWVASPVALLAIGSILIAFLGMGTNFQFKLSDTPMFILGTSLFVLDRGVEKALEFRALVTASALLLLALYAGRTRVGYSISNDWVNDECGQVMITDSFLSPMRACPILSEVLAEVKQSMNQSKDSVFFGPNLEFLYADYRLTSPLHLPNWWDPGTSYALSKTNGIAEAWEKDNFTKLIFLRPEDVVQLPLQVRKDIEQHYVVQDGPAHIRIYQRR